MAYQCAGDGHRGALTSRTSLPEVLQFACSLARCRRQRRHCLVAKVDAECFSEVSASMDNDLE